MMIILMDEGDRDIDGARADYLTKLNNLPWRNIYYQDITGSLRSEWSIHCHFGESAV